MARYGMATLVSVEKYFGEASRKENEQLGETSSAAVEIGWTHPY